MPILLGPFYDRNGHTIGVAVQDRSTLIIVSEDALLLKNEGRISECFYTLQRTLKQLDKRITRNS
jgi:hypothetical protein